MDPAENGNGGHPGRGPKVEVDEFQYDSQRFTGKRAGTIRRIHVENFMCHSNLDIEFSDRVNFLTGQNGSGKSAILTAILVAFGMKAKGTQRANSIKDFVKNGCRTSSVVIELNNEGLDAYKPDIFGDTIVIERRITDNLSQFHVGSRTEKKIGTKRVDVLDIVEHFNIDVENPCILMTQDKSREFLHAGSEKDKFMFFFKATLQQAVSEKLVLAEEAQDTLAGIVRESLDALRPLREEVKQIEDKIKYKEQVEKLQEQIVELEKTLAWAWVLETERALEEKRAELEKVKQRIPQCERKIAECQAKADDIRELYAAKKSEIDRMMIQSQQHKHKRDALQRDERESYRGGQSSEMPKTIAQLTTQLKTLEENVQEMQLRARQDTQVEEDLRQKQIEGAEDAVKRVNEEVARYLEEEHRLLGEGEGLRESRQACENECREKLSQIREVEKYIKELTSRRGNKVTAFGGNNVLGLLKSIEDTCQRFTRAPLGPIGAFVTLRDERWSLAVEVATRNLLDSFIVTNQKDMLLLRRLANQANCRNLNICIYDFDRPPLRPSEGQLPDANLITIMTILHSESAVVMNVLIDLGSVERLVLAEDYDAGKIVAFMMAPGTLRRYRRGGAETTLPKDRWIRGGRLGVKVDDQIRQAQQQEKEIRDSLVTLETRKRSLEETQKTVGRDCAELKRKRIMGEKRVKTLEFSLQELKSRAAIEKHVDANVGELDFEVSKVRDEIQHKQEESMELTAKWDLAKERYSEAKTELDTLLSSARGDVQAMGEAEQDLLSFQEQLNDAVSEVKHYQHIRESKVTAVIASIEVEISDLQKSVDVNGAKASQICPRDEVSATEVESWKPDMLSSKLKRLRDRVRKDESDPETLEQLKKKGNKLKWRFQSKEDVFLGLNKKLNTLGEGLERRKRKFDRNAQHQRRELTWQFNEHLRKKGFSGKINVDYHEQSLTLHVTMPQDESRSSVQDTRALSGGERSYSTLAFALAVHGMTEAPFRAMDEFDIFMDPVSRKISLDAVVKFAKDEGSQWILITPHDISAVETSSSVKKQMMPAPRP